MNYRTIDPQSAGYNLGEKALACLAMAELPASAPERSRLYAVASSRWSEKAVCAKFEELNTRGYMECGVTARSGWLTPKGRDALARSRASGAPA